MIRDEVQTLLKSALSKLSITEDAPLQFPANPNHGDYSSSIALQAAKKLGRNPVELAQEIVDAIPQNALIEKIEVAKPGFVNFTLSKQALFNEVKEISLTNEPLHNLNKTILLEYGQPNTHKTPHIGHLFSYIFGESLSRLLEAMGADVKRLNYQGDIGLHVAKCLYVASKRAFNDNDYPSARDRHIVYLQECYQEGSKLYESSEEAKIAIDELNKKIYDKDPSIVELWRETREWSVQFYRDTFEKVLGIREQKYYFESDVAAEGKNLVTAHLGKVFEESEGAVVFKGEPHNLHTRVFINKFGNPTYEGKEIGLQQLKQRDFPTFDFSITTTASEQNEYFKVVYKATELVYPQLKGKLKHIGFGLINLTTGKMSSRTGEIVDGMRLFEDVRNEIKSEYNTEDDDAETIALSAIKYSFLKSEAKLNKSFDIKTSIAREGDSGPYLLYTYVRTQSVLSKERPQGDSSTDITLSDVERLLLRTLSRFPEIVEKAALQYAPHLVAGYLYELTKTFNLFYQTCPILTESPPVKEFRLALTHATGQVLHDGLKLLGIETVEKM